MSAETETATLWIREQITPWDYYGHGVTRMIVSTRTKFQEMLIVETGAYGKSLVLDGKWQSCTGDEFLYHEPLVQPAMIAHGGPRRVLILGGGEGATAREVLRWKTVERAVMIDIDGEVVDACREHLAEMHCGAFDDPRLEVVIADALHYLDHSADEWDVIISDLSDPIEEGPSFKLFTREYFQKCRSTLAADGVFVLQAGPVGPIEMGMHARLASTMRAVFDHVVSYASHIPSYASPWGFLLGSANAVDICPAPAATDALLADNTRGGLRMLDGVSLLGLYHLPKNLRNAVAEETEVYTLTQPPKFFGKSNVKMVSN